MVLSGFCHRARMMPVVPGGVSRTTPHGALRDRGPMSLTWTLSPTDQFWPWSGKVKSVVVPGLSMGKDFRSAPVPISRVKNLDPRRPSALVAQEDSAMLNSRLLSYRSGVRDSWLESWRCGR